MPSAIFTIGRSGLTASRLSLELTAQNIANAANPDYSRRTLTQSELVMTGNIGIGASADSLGGIRPGVVVRAESALVQRQARDTSSALAAAEAEFFALREAESALEASGVFTGLVEFEAALTRLEGNPLEPALRLSALESARQMAGNFRVADSTLANARRLVQDEAAAEVLTVNELAAELAEVNRDLVAAREGTAGRAALLDARDKALRGLAEQFGIATVINANGTADVSLDGAPPVALVTGGVTANVDLSVNPDGTLAFDVGGTAFAPAGGAMAGRASALSDIAGLQAGLDSLAQSVIGIANAAQAAGVDSAGNPGQPLLGGTGAADIDVALASASGLATAPAGAPAGSRDTSNLAALLATLGAETGPASQADALLLSLSSRVAALDTRREGLGVVAASAEAELLRETGVDLDTEAANLVRLQQAFEANSRVIQVATELFDTLLGLR
ncbi:flagellar hook-associated protein FlgK [Erythrobacter dokdonensis]|uniref:Flagellar hook-associated protein 1 n=1 Tax=Erythrobacter dokdonensis DSW-74 TaxID=1300349 RepID=A0A1A7BHN4_9SPHN|nr:flagellar hook-associated protein FlgK [Erythrobacter dokdonensis]OBV10942.1 Flagellar hook-associated protein 1 [Erythrobacter dokdonensis DSW-74]